MNYSKNLLIITYLHFVGVGIADSPQSASTELKPSVALIINVDDRELSKNLASIESTFSGAISNLGINLIIPKTIVQSSGSDKSNDQTLPELASQDSSNLRLSQNLNSDYFLRVGIGLYSVESKKFADKSLDLAFETEIHSINVSYSLHRSYDGVTIGGNTFAVSKSVNQTVNTIKTSSNIGSLLVFEGAKKLAPLVSASLGAIDSGKFDRQLVKLKIAASADNKFGAFSKHPSFLAPDGQNVEFIIGLTADIILDGFLVGSTPGEYQTLPGIHEVSIIRNGYKPYKRNINLINDLVITASMELTDSERKKWENDTKFLYELDRDNSLTEAEIMNIIQKAKSLEKNGYVFDVRVDTKEGIKVRDTNLINAIRKGLRKDK